MNKKIEQVAFGRTMSFFEKGLMDRWGLNRYHDINSPCLFFGVWGNEDLISNHKSFCLIFPVDISCAQKINNVPNKENIIVVDRPHIKIPDRFKKFGKEFEIKDYSSFKPTVMGEKIYAYVGQPERREQFNLNLIQQIQNNINFDIIIGEHKNIYSYLDINTTKTMYYNPSFLNLNFSTESGLTTVIEMAFMGRKTISNSPLKWECMIPYDDLDDIINIINRESKKIGTIQKSIDVHQINDVWQTLEYWENFT